MIETYRSDQRGSTAIDWLRSRHSFSFNEWHDPTRVNFGSLRVINEDVVAPGAGFPTHGHRDMEIVTYVLSGALAHKDSLDNGSTIRPGEIQRMTAGSGIRHSEMNPSTTEPTHLLQIWILPESRGFEPGYEQRTIRLPPSQCGFVEKNGGIHRRLPSNAPSNVVPDDRRNTFS